MNSQMVFAGIAAWDLFYALQLAVHPLARNLSYALCLFFTLRSLATSTRAG